MLADNVVWDFLDADGNKVILSDQRPCCYYKAMAQSTVVLGSDGLLHEVIKMPAQDVAPCGRCAMEIAEVEKLPIIIEGYESIRA